MIHLSRMELRMSERALTMKWRRLLQVMILMTLINMGKAVDEITCNDDSECSPEQYCYKVSSICVNYTVCSRYNRHEGEFKAQSSAQCGPCKKGYTAEILGIGHQAAVCNKDLTTENVFLDDKKKNEFVSQKIIPWIGVGVILAVLILISIVRCLAKNVKNKHEPEKKWFCKMRSWSFTPSAPLPDSAGAYHLQRPYYSEEEPPVYSAVINNNNNVKDRNRLVNAVPSIAPDWVQIDPSYDHDDPDTSTSTSASTTFHVEDEETTPSSWTPEQINVPVPARAFHQFAPEQRDNVLNTVLVRGDCSSASSSDRESNGGPAPEATSSSRTSGDAYRGPHVQINQMITLNMVKSDN